MDLYADNILDHYRHPRKTGVLSSPTVAHTEVNASCGDEITLQLHIVDDRIADISWSGTGCAISQAGMSMLSEEVVSKSISELHSFSPQPMFDLPNVPIGPRRLKCALLALHTVKNAIHLHRDEPPQDWNATMES